MDLLQAVRDEPGLGNTRLLLLANLSNDRLREYLAELQGKGWVVSTEEDGRVAWRISSQGLAVLGDLERVRRLMEDYGLGL